MTKREYQARKMAVPRPTPAQKRARYEAHLLAELTRIGWKVEPKGPYQLYLAKGN